MALNIGELVGYLKLDRKQWNAGLTAAREQLKRLGAGNDDLNQMQSRISKIGNGFKMAALQAGNLQWVIFGVAGAVQLVGAASGVLGVGIGALAAMGAAAATVKLGADGIKKAFEGTEPALDRLKAKVSATFQKELAPAVRDINQLLPQTTARFQGIAVAISGTIRQVAQLARERASVNSLNATLWNSEDIVRNLGAVAAPIVRIFLDIASVGTSMLAQLTGGAGRVATRFADWVSAAKESGQLWAWMQKGVDTIKQLGSYIGGIVALFVHIFQALQQGAGATSLSIDQIVGSLIGLAAVVTGNPVLAFIGFLASTAIPILQQFMQTAEGQEVFRQLGDAMNRIGNVVSSVLTTAVMALAPLIPPLVSAFADLAEQALPPLIDAITFLAPVLLNIATFIQQNIDWIGPLAAALGVWTAAQWLLNIALDANPIGLVIIAIGALIAIVALIITYWEPISGFFVDLWNTIWKWTSDRITDITNFIVSVWGGIVEWFKGLGAKIGAAFTTVIDWFAALPGKIGDFFAALPGILWDAFTSAFAFALNAVIQGIEWVIAEVIALPFQIANALIGLGELLGSLARDAWTAFIDSAQTIGAALIEWVLALPGRIYEGLISLVVGLGGLARDAWNAFIQSAKDGGVAIYQFALALPGRIISGIAALGSMLSSAAGAAWRWFISTMRDTAEGIWSFVTSIPGRITGALGDLGSLLWKAGKTIIDGLLAGLKAAVGGVWDFVSGIGDKIAKLKGPLPYDRQLLVPAGLAIMGGLHAGLKEGFKPIQAWVSGVGDTIAGSVASNVRSPLRLMDVIKQGDVSQDEWQRLLGLGWKGDPTDGMEALHRPGGDTSTQPRALVQIENYHPPADASPHEVATDLDWLSRTGG